MKLYEHGFSWIEILRLTDNHHGFYATMHIEVENGGTFHVYSDKMNIPLYSENYTRIKGYFEELINLYKDKWQPEWKEWTIYPYITCNGTRHVLNLQFDPYKLNLGYYEII